MKRATSFIKEMLPKIYSSLEQLAIVKEKRKIIEFRDGPKDPMLICAVHVLEIKEHYDDVI